MKDSYTMNDMLAMKGIIELRDISGLEENPFRFAELIAGRHIFLCRLRHGRQTLVGRHLVLCLRAVCCEQSLSPSAQALYDWLSENQGSTLDAMEAGCGLEHEEMRSALEELQRRMVVGPIKVLGFAGLAQKGAESVYTKEDSFLWATDEYLFAGIVPGARYDDIGYCIQELRELLKVEFADWEINRLLYHSA